MPRVRRIPWLLLIHRVPAKPDYLRVRIGRRLHRLGAVAIKSSVYVLPAVPKTRGALAELAREIVRQGGEAVVCNAEFVEGLADGGVEDLFRQARAGEYSAIAADARRLATVLRGGRASDAVRRSTARRLDRLRLRFDDVVARDPFGAPGREPVVGLLSLIEDRLQGVDAGAPRDGPTEPPRGATWVTRSGVMVDRVASAWLIRRFVDSRAEFKFVPARGYKPGPGEIRFDMGGAEFTHQGDRCTFEVLVERFGIRDSALRPIAEIVHDLDLEDEKYGRAETAGVDRMIVGLAIARKPDPVRLEQGAVVFDNLYASFSRSRRGRIAGPPAANPGSIR